MSQLRFNSAGLTLSTPGDLAISLGTSDTVSHNLFPQPDEKFLMSKHEDIQQLVPSYRIMLHFSFPVCPVTFSP